MRRTARLSAIALICLPLGWTMLWLGGRTLVDGQLDTALRTLSENGYVVYIGRQEIGGFPFAYRLILDDVVATDTRSGRAYRLNRVESQFEASDPDAITLRLPEPVVFTLPGGQGVLEIENEGLEVRLGGLTGTASQVQIDAASLLMIAWLPDGTRAALELIGVEALASRPGAGEAGVARLRTTIERAEWLATLEGRAKPTAIQGEAEGLLLTGSLLDPDALAPLALGALPGTAAFALTGERAEVRLRPPELDGDTLAMTAGPLNAVLDTEGTAMTARASLHASETVRLDGEGTALGALSTGPVQLIHRGPLAPAPEMAPLALSLEIANARLDPQTQARLDTGAPEDTAPGALSLDLVGTGRLMRPKGALPGHPAELQIGNLAIERAEASGLGASVEAGGGIEFLQPLQQPQGRATVDVEGGLGLLQRLRAAELIEQSTLLLLSAGAAFYLRPGESPDSLGAEVVFENGEISVNGKRVR
ncbi:MAG: DUF2125 domain-containing protein [Pseudomonadota bacterium]